MEGFILCADVRAGAEKRDQVELYIGGGYIATHALEGLFCVLSRVRLTVLADTLYP